MALVVDRFNLGTDEAAWRCPAWLNSLARLALPSTRRVVVLAPHPDDEVFGVGGLLQVMARLGHHIELLAVTDGEASHPQAVARGYDLPTVRANERARALRRLGCGAATVTRLKLADGSVAERIDHLSERVADVLEADDLCIAPWRHDGHPDHDACGNAALAAVAASGAHLIEYLVWAWHWTSPHTDGLPWERCRSLSLDWNQTVRKRWAIRAFVSQIRPLGPDHVGQALMPAEVLLRFRRRYEVFLVDEGLQ